MTTERRYLRFSLTIFTDVFFLYLRRYLKWESFRFVDGPLILCFFWRSRFPCREFCDSYNYENFSRKIFLTFISKKNCSSPLRGSKMEYSGFLWFSGPSGGVLGVFFRQHPTPIFFPQSRRRHFQLDWREIYFTSSMAAMLARDRSAWIRPV